MDKTSGGPNGHSAAAVSWAELGSRSSSRDLHRERDQQQAAPHGFVDGSRGADEWLPVMNSLKVGVKSKKSCRMKRAVILSPPVTALSLASSQRRPFLVSVATTKRAPRSLARSVGCRSLFEAMNVLMSAMVA